VIIINFECVKPKAQSLKPESFLNITNETNK
jgi:hypothetical protein